MTKTRSAKRTFFPNIDYTQAIFLQHHSYPELAEPMNTTYGFTGKFIAYLNKNQDAFEDVAKFIPAVKETIIEYIKDNAFNTLNGVKVVRLL